MEVDNEENSDEEINPIRLFLPENDGDQPVTTTRALDSSGKQKQEEEEEEEEVKHNHHYLRSLDSTVVIRQLPSQGLSFRLWPAATTLVNLLDTKINLFTQHHHHHCRALRILELGSGTGLVGISAAIALKANVTITDLPHVTTNLQFNAELNSKALISHGGSVEVAALRWGEKEDMEMIGREFDVILASDVVYHSHLYEPLLDTLRYLLGGEEKLVFVMAHLRRWKKDSTFFRKARKLFHVQIIDADDPLLGSRVGVTVYKFVAKPFADDLIAM